MSSIKKFCLRSDSQNSVSINEFESKVDNYKRDSFKDRFCDDLCEDILQFMPIEDKFRYECVSKQFQRTVFVKQYSLNVEVVSKTRDYSLFEMHLKSIESVLKKCPNIQQIDARSAPNYEMHKNIIQLITKYCNHLIEYNGYLIHSNEEEFKEYHQKFRSKLKEGIIASPYLNNFVLFPNLQTLSQEPDVDLDDILQLNSRQVKRLEFYVYEEEEYKVPEVLQKFKEIRRLSLHLYTDSEESVFNALKESAVLQNLIELKYITTGVQNGNQFLDSLKYLAKKFPKLKSIEIKSVSLKDLKQQLCALKAFPSLKRLDLELIFLKYQYMNEFSLKPFQELQNITHLSLGFTDRPLDEEILTDIDIYLPKLQYLLIKSEIITYEEGVTQMAESLSRLSSLHTINLGKLKYGRISELMTTKTAKKCRKIRKIHIY